MQCDFGEEHEGEFKRQFAVHFLSTWAANNYTGYCMKGWQSSLGKPPVEDAQFLADKAWEHWKETIGTIPPK